MASASGTTMTPFRLVTALMSSKARCLEAHCLQRFVAKATNPVAGAPSPGCSPPSFCDDQRSPVRVESRKASRPLPSPFSGQTQPLTRSPRRCCLPPQPQTARRLRRMRSTRHHLVRLPLLCVSLSLLAPSPVEGLELKVLSPGSAQAALEVSPC